MTYRRSIEFDPRKGCRPGGRRTREGVRLQDAFTSSLHARIIHKFRADYKAQYGSNPPHGVAGALLMKAIAKKEQAEHRAQHEDKKMSFLDRLRAGRKKI